MVSTIESSITMASVSFTETVRNWVLMERARVGIILPADLLHVAVDKVHLYQLIGRSIKIFFWSLALTLSTKSSSE